MRADKVLTSACRNCGKPITFDTQPIREGMEERVARSRAYHARWWHTGREDSDEHRCDPTVKYGQAAKAVDYCAEMPQGRYSADICNRPVREKDPSKPYAFLCGIHLNMRRKDEEKSQQHRDDWTLSEYLMTETDKLRDILMARFSINSTRHLDRNFKTTGMIVVNPRELLSFLEEIFDG